MSPKTDAVVSQFLPFGLEFEGRECLKVGVEVADAVEESPSLTTLRVAQTYVSANALAKLTGSAGSIGGAAGVEGEEFALRYEALLEGTPEFLTVDRIVTEKVPAVGVCVELRVKRLSVDFRADIYSVAAAATLKSASVQFERKIMPPDSKVMEGVPERGVLTSDAYEQLLDGVSRALRNMGSMPDLKPSIYYRPGGFRSMPDLKPSIYYRPGGFAFSQEGEMEEAWAVCFAASQLAQDVKLNEALGEARRRHLDQGIVQTTYEYFWPKPDDGRPPRGAREAARRLLGW